MENQNTAPIPTLDNTEPPIGSTPWLKYVGIIFVLLVLINGGLYLYYLKKNNLSIFRQEVAPPRDESGFLVTTADRKISREGYNITFFNPRYENLDAQSFFRVDVTLVNESFEPKIEVIANCDIEENGIVVRPGAGVTVENGESRPVLPGNSNSWTALVVLEDVDQKVTSCIYAPEGIFTSEETVRVVF